MMSPGSLSFAKLVMMSSAPAKSTGDARYASQDPIIQSMLSYTISTPICIRTQTKGAQKEFKNQTIYLNAMSMTYLIIVPFNS